MIEIPDNQYRCGDMFCMVRRQLGIGKCTQAELIIIMANNPKANPDEVEAYIKNVEENMEDCEKQKELQVSIDYARRTK